MSRTYVAEPESRSAAAAGSITKVDHDAEIDVSAKHVAALESRASPDTPLPKPRPPRREVRDEHPRAANARGGPGLGESSAMRLPRNDPPHVGRQLQLQQGPLSETIREKALRRTSTVLSLACELPTLFSRPPSAAVAVAPAVLGVEAPSVGEMAAPIWTADHGFS
jgi:hypothetical protein